MKRIIELEVGKIVSLLEVVRKRKLQSFGDVVGQSGDSLRKTTLEGMGDVKRSRGRPEKNCLINDDNIYVCSKVFIVKKSS